MKNEKRILDSYRGHTLGIAFAVLLILLLDGGAGASPFAYIPNYGDLYGQNVSVIDTAINKVVDTINLPCPYGVAVNPAGTRVYVTRPCVGMGSISVINTTTDKVTDTFFVGESTYGVAVSPDGTKIYATNEQKGTISQIDAISDTQNYVTNTIPVGKYPKGVAVNPSGTTIYVANGGSNTISVINVATLQTTQVAVGNSPFGIVVSPDGTKVYVTNQVSGSVSVIDTASNTVTATVQLGEAPRAVMLGGIAVNPAGTEIYVSTSENAVDIINATSNKVKNIVPLNLPGGIGCGAPEGVAINPDGRVYAVCTSGFVAVIYNYAVTNIINVGEQPIALGQFIGPTLNTPTSTPTPTSTSTSTSIPTSAPAPTPKPTKPIPGFDLIASALGVIIVTYLHKRRF